MKTKKSRLGVALALLVFGMIGAIYSSMNTTKAAETVKGNATHTGSFSLPVDASTINYNVGSDWNTTSVTMTSTGTNSTSPKMNYSGFFGHIIVCGPDQIRSASHSGNSTGKLKVTCTTDLDVPQKNDFNISIEDKSHGTWQWDIKASPDAYGRVRFKYFWKAPFLTGSGGGGGPWEQVFEGEKTLANATDLSTENFNQHLHGVFHDDMFPDDGTDYVAEFDCPVRFDLETNIQRTDDDREDEQTYHAKHKEWTLIRTYEITVVQLP